jgi:hypothetical protein
MRLLLTFIVTVLSSVGAVCLFCILVERLTSSSFISLLLFFPLFFVTIVGSWLVSVKITQPKPGHVPELQARKA